MQKVFRPGITDIIIIAMRWHNLQAAPEAVLLDDAISFQQDVVGGISTRSSHQSVAGVRPFSIRPLNSYSFYAQLHAVGDDRDHQPIR